MLTTYALDSPMQPGPITARMLSFIPGSTTIYKCNLAVIMLSSDILINFTTECHLHDKTDTLLEWEQTKDKGLHSIRCFDTSEIVVPVMNSFIKGCYFLVAKLKSSLQKM